MSKFNSEDSEVITISSDDDDKQRTLYGGKNADTSSSAKKTSIKFATNSKRKKPKIMLPRKLPPTSCSDKPSRFSGNTVLRRSCDVEINCMSQDKLSRISSFDSKPIVSNNPFKYAVDTFELNQEDDLLDIIEDDKSPSSRYPWSNSNTANFDDVTLTSRASSCNRNKDRFISMEREKKERQEALQRDKEMKRLENELIRNQKPGEAWKFITMAIDSHIPNIEDLTQLLETAEIKYEVLSNTVFQNSVTFKRELVYQAMGDDLKLKKISTFEDEDQIMIVMNAEDFIPKVYIHAHQGDADLTDVDDISAIAYVKLIQSTCPSQSVTLIIVGLDNYFRKVKVAAQKEFRERVKSLDKPQTRRRKDTNKLLTITQNEFQDCMVELQLSTCCVYRLVNTKEQLVKLLTQYLKAIADAPFKRQRKEIGFDFYAESGGSVKVDKDGGNLERLWVEQLRLFPKVGVETAQAISSVYPTPAILTQAYDRCESVEERMDLLSDVTVWTGAGVLATKRRIGKELSKKIFRCFTSTDPNLCLGSS